MRLKSIIAIALIPQIILVNYLKKNPSIIDKYYQNIYEGILSINSSIYSKIKIPVGEIVYIIIILFFIYLIFKIFSFKLKDSVNLIAFISIIYFTFYSLWGLNYFKTSKFYKSKVKNDYEFVELDNTLKQIIYLINEELELIKDFNQLDLFEITNTKDLNLKKSIIPNILLYQTVSGHFNPFTSEYIVNFKIPKIDIPVVIFHEEAHRNGYAHEAEASFIGFKKAVESENANIRYSGYFYALLKLLNDVNRNHNEKLEDYTSILNERIKADINDNIEFWSKYYNNFFDRITNFIYDIYLKSNKQENGILSYNKVSKYIIDYYKVN